MKSTSNINQGKHVWLSVTKEYYVENNFVLIMQEFKSNTKIRAIMRLISWKVKMKRSLLWIAQKSTILTPLAAKKLLASKQKNEIDK